MSFLSASPVHQPAQQLSVKKRKRDETTTHSHLPTEIDSRPLVIRPTGDDPFAKAINFTPVCVLHRAQLPLAFLAAESCGSRLFTAHVQTLESFHDNGEEGRILVAEQKEEGRLYVIERTSKRVYALCRLGAWITKDTVNHMSKADTTGTAASDRAVKRRVVDCTKMSPWWAQAAVEIPKETPRAPSGLLQLTARSEMPGLAREKVSKPENPQATKDSGTQLMGDAPQGERGGTQNADSGPLDPLEELAKQYLDALYLSRTSLAYFAKGPLSRARSTFTGATDPSTSSLVLAEFLRNAILPATTMDKKYRDNITAIIKDLPVVNPSPVKTRRKKKFKPKRDKAGLFTNEQDYLEKWWRGEEVSGHMVSPENIDTRLRRRVPELRTRETYMQIILILETLFLETANKTAYQQAGNAAHAALESQGAESQDVDSQTATKRRVKKPLDLHMHLETLLDRLCIWQSLESHTPGKSLQHGDDAKNNESSNELRNFCVEIIVPFFMARLPKEAALVNKKLGGPSPPSPEKRKSTSSRSKPGEPAIRSRPETQSRKPLSRVATETLNHTSKPIPGLHRSATDSALIKREDSQPSLASIPPAVPPRKPRESLLKSYSSSHRQVDLNASSAAAAEKLRKKRETEAQVREAIANARKPNRPMATKEVAARADERFAQTLAKSSSRSSRPQGGVHVAATPKRPKSTLTTQHIPASHHGSQPSVVPSSSTRYRAAPPSLSRIDSTLAVPQTERRTATTSVVGIEETPSRESSLKFAPISPSALRAAPLNLRETSLCESPTARRTTSHIAATPVKGVTRRVSFGLPQTPNMHLRGNHEIAPATSAALVQGTPIRPAAAAAASGGLYSEQDFGGAAGGAGAGAGVGFGDGDGVGTEIAGRSIYDAWNDDDYEELA